MIKRLLYFLRNFVYRQTLEAVRKYSGGDILDVGGGDFYKTFLGLGCDYKSYTIADKRRISLSENSGGKIRYQYTDAGNMDFQDDSFDTVLCIHMLEHTLKPLEVISEIRRVLRKDGVAIFLLPQTSVPHDIPKHYYNFTRYFIEEALNENQMKITEINMLGGAFQTMASHIFHLPLFLFGNRDYRDKRIRRGLLFYVTLPVRVLLIPPLFILSLILSFGDIKEVANNILVVVRKI